MPKGVTDKVVDRMLQAYHIISMHECATTAYVMEQLGVGHTEAMYVLTMLLKDKHIVEVVLGKSSIWCKDRESANRLIRRLKSEVVKLVGTRKFISPKELFTLISQDKEARKVFRHIIRLDKPTPHAYSVLVALFKSLYGEPMGRKYSTIQPNMNINITIKDHTDKIINTKKYKLDEHEGKMVLISFHVTPQMLKDLEEYASRAGMTRSEVVRTAVRRMIEKMKR